MRTRGGVALRTWLAAAAIAMATALVPAAAHPMYIGRVTAVLGDSTLGNSVLGNSVLGNTVPGNSVLGGRLSVNRLDLLQALGAAHGDRLFSLSRPELDGLTSQYLQSRLRAVVDGDTLALVIGRTGQNRDEVWFDFAFPAPAAPRLLTLEVTVLFELFPEQRNLLELTTPRGVHRHVFAPTHPTLVLEVAPP